MPAHRMNMRMIKDVLRLKFDAGFSHDRIAASLGISRVKVKCPSCISFGALRVDQRVSDEVLRRLEPLGIRASLDAIERNRMSDDERVRHKELALEQARYEASRARRQYDAIDPDNRLVAAELERRWNDALAIQAQRQAELDALREQPADSLSSAARDELMRWFCRNRAFW